MDYEKNKDALDVVRQMVADGQLQQKVAAKYFPELKESREDEMIRVIKEVILNSVSYKINILTKDTTITAEEAIAWLEKQGERKHQYNSRPRYIGEEKLLGEKNHLYRVEPKFKIGDWLKHKTMVSEPFYITDIKDGYYLTNQHSFINFDTEDNYRYWTIKDAKDGDVLATLDYILIFKKFLSKDGGVSYCHYDFGCSTPQFNFNEDDNWYFGKEAIVHPATKEQRDLLFAKTKEAGYEWDVENKKLNKLVEPKQEISDVDMTKYEKVLSDMLDEYGQDPDRMKYSIIAKYGMKIRKQIASEIESEYESMVNFYKRIL